MKRIIIITILLQAMMFGYSQNQTINGNLTITGSDFSIKCPSRGNNGQGRALVHDANNALSMNYDGDFNGGVRIWGPKVDISGNAWIGNELQVIGKLGVGGTQNQNYGKGTEFRLDGTEWNFATMYMYKYTSQNPNLAELRMNISDYGWRDYHKFVIGYTDLNSGVWSPLYTFNSLGNMGIGTSNPQNKLDVNGTIRAKEVRVESGWADFVFKPDYQLPSLDEVKAHIDEHQHLPGIPSEAEVKENGVGLSEITTKMMQKIEELTLYAIQQNEKASEQQRVIDQLREEINELKSNQK